MADQSPDLRIHVALLRAAREEHGDLIVIATRGRGFLGRAMVGSVADKVVRSGVAPVMLVPVAERSTA